MKHTYAITMLKKAEVETKLTVGQVLTLVANILSVVAQAFIAKEEGSTTITSTK
ncbi:MAG TPA: hypothetical protein PLT82_07715 [Candidatus Hydrogenedens sp.]|nr:hypothetical protein [Candidatus Hydrogenedens sp.]HOK09463.1 hypothetical protein [Candidatus Hydrogenedens sp.]HOL18946.1 hypothetical protein [Candidatus Hydrogenedens sp.]HPP59002.1 hypothetical protein [Candidatus Hydrogenedens sp.]